MLDENEDDGGWSCKPENRDEVEDAAEKSVDPRLVFTDGGPFSRLFFSSKAERGNGCTALVFEVENERGRAIGPKLLQAPLELPLSSC